LIFIPPTFHGVIFASIICSFQYYFIHHNTNPWERKDILSAYFNFSRYIQDNPHFNHQKQRRSSSVTDKRKRDAGRWNHIQNNSDIQNNLNRDVREHPSHNKRSVKIRRILCNKHQPVKKHAKQYQNDNQAEDSQFLADDGKNHIIL